MALIEEDVIRPGELDERQYARMQRAQIACKRRVQPVAVAFLSGHETQLYCDEEPTHVLTYDEDTCNVTESIRDPITGEMVVQTYASGWFRRDGEPDGGDGDGGLDLEGAPDWLR